MMLYAFPLAPTTTAKSSHIHFMRVAVVICFMIVAIISKSVLVEAAVAHTAITTTAKSIRSTSSSSSLSSLTMMAITAGSRTLIEIGNNKKNGNQQKDDQYKIDSSYLDGDFDNGLLILRRVVSIDKNMEHEEEHKSSSLLHKLSHAVTNNRTTVTGIVVGNVASMMGIVPVGLSGFIPALSIMIGMKMKSKGFLSSMGTAFQQKKKKKKAQATTTAVID